jgi:hypothetical protein
MLLGAGGVPGLAAEAVLAWAVRLVMRVLHRPHQMFVKIQIQALEQGVGSVARSAQAEPASRSAAIFQLSRPEVECGRAGVTA